ncbi:MAG: ribonuclease E/G [Paracoccus sp. (in: a-proteobacteria)]|uniref:ribonuclease E/G n=1 Tax=Paracoccus sp. TaxID=267 RepID=UPI0026E0AC1C|nr:ribonuclease E/G [Paracoccus sp. (in: a-proteobacteria)]MDO5621432.1 ribonuclease E/G [Paracoccus sp. (in: a-proteobacteria)]
MKQVVIGDWRGHPAAALFQDRQLIELEISPAAVAPLPPGTVCRAVVDRLVKGQGGVFLRLPEGQSGFLRTKSGLRQGQVLLVQVSGIAEDGKAVPVSDRILLRGRLGIVSIGAPGVNVSRSIKDPELRDELTGALRPLLAEGDPGIIIRSAAAGAGSEALTEELVPLLELARQLAADLSGGPETLLDAPEPAETAWQDWSDPAPDLFEDGPQAFEQTGALDAIDALLDPRLDLGQGAFAYIEPTRAAICVDVNTGSDTSPAAALKANIALARDLPRQLRLRGLGGQVVIDFAPVSKRDRGTIEQVIRSAARPEGGALTVVGWTAMGLFEMTRKRDRVPLTRLAGRG